MGAPAFSHCANPYRNRPADGSSSADTRLAEPVQDSFPEVISMANCRRQFSITDRYLFSRITENRHGERSRARKRQAAPSQSSIKRGNHCDSLLGRPPSTFTSMSQSSIKRGNHWNEIIRELIQMDLFGSQSSIQRGNHWNNEIEEIFDTAVECRNPLSSRVSILRKQLEVSL